MIVNLLSVIAFVFAILYAKGWIVSTSFANCLALIALGLLIPALIAILGWTPTIRPPRRSSSEGT